MYILMVQFLTTTIVWGHMITLPSDVVHHVTLQVSGYLYAKFYLIRVCSIRVIEITNLMNYVSVYYVYQLRGPTLQSRIPQQIFSGCFSWYTPESLYVTLCQKSAFSSKITAP